MLLKRMLPVTAGLDGMLPAKCSTSLVADGLSHCNLDSLYTADENASEKVADCYSWRRYCVVNDHMVNDHMVNDHMVSDHTTKSGIIHKTEAGQISLGFMTVL